MANRVLSGCCGLRPLPFPNPNPATRPVNPLPIRVRVPTQNLSATGTVRINPSRPISRGWALKVSAPTLVVAPLEGADADADAGFDPGMPPAFGLAEIRAAIPKHCWVRDARRSMGYVLRDVVVVAALAVAAARVDSWLAWPIYWAAQGTMFWALFVLGHDCGHGSFSSDAKVNSVVGHFLHSSILVPYHGWRISHRTHHQNHGHVENDESWHPLSRKIYASLDFVSRKTRFTLPFPMFAYPFYLWVRSPGKKGSHYNPNSDLFLPNEKKDVITSTACWSAMVAVLAGLTWFMGPMQMLKLYFVPYLVFVMWLDLVTYLHHHGHEEKLPWYRGKPKFMTLQGLFC